jgi:hypothetical protein
MDINCLYHTPPFTLPLPVGFHPHTFPTQASFYTPDFLNSAYGIERAVSVLHSLAYFT